MSNSKIGAPYTLDYRGRHSRLGEATLPRQIRKWAKATLNKLDRTMGLKALAADIKALTGAVDANLEPVLVRVPDEIADWESYLAKCFPEPVPEFDAVAAPDASEDTLTWADLEWWPILGSHTEKNPGTRLAMMFQVSREDDGYEGYDAFGDA